MLVNLLPSTPETRLLLDAARLSRLPAGAFVVCASRGDQLDAAALVALLDRGHLAGALLDVFETEPLPDDSPLWRHPAVRITPHVAAITLPEVSVAQIVAKARALLAGQRHRRHGRSRAGLLSAIGAGGGPAIPGPEAGRLGTSHAGSRRRHFPSERRSTTP